MNDRQPRSGASNSLLIFVVGSVVVFGGLAFVLFGGLNSHRGTGELSTANSGTATAGKDRNTAANQGTDDELFILDDVHFVL